jgi:hypothetical protein
VNAPHLKGPSRDVAADFLRYVADYYKHGELLDDPTAIAEALSIIAACIEGNGVTFRRGGKYRRPVQQHIVVAAWLVEHGRAGGESIRDALSREAKALAALLPNEDDLEGQIAACRKQQKKEGWPLRFPGLVQWKSDGGSKS